MTKRLTFLLAFGLVTLVAACVPPGNPQLVAEPDNVTLRLANAADRAANALDTLASIEQTRTPTDLPPLTLDAPPELRRSITVKWMGPVEPLVKQLADRASYDLHMSGNKPAIGIIVNIDVRNQPIIETLRDIGLQMGGRGDLKVDASQKIIELHYGSVQVEAP